MPTYDEVIVTLLFFSMLIWEYLSGIYSNNKRNRDEWLVDIISLIQLPIIKSTVLFLAFQLGVLILPDVHNVLQDMPFWLGFLLVFIPDDYSHYWIHQASHKSRFLWPFHRTHHTPTVYQTSIAFRENWLWFWIMPGFWWAGLMVYFGLIEQVILSTAIIGVRNVWIHTGFHWDKKMYSHPIGSKVMKIVEHIINPPGLHRGHHGMGKNGVPFGNYAQTLFIWDVMFGTAVFKNGAIPEYYAIAEQDIMQQPWYYQLWWPISKKKDTTVNTDEVL